MQKDSEWDFALFAKKALEFTLLISTFCGFSGGGLFSPLTDFALRKFDGQINESKICQTLKQRKNEANSLKRYVFE